jgi:hypothetical protein
MPVAFACKNALGRSAIVRALSRQHFPLTLTLSPVGERGPEEMSRFVTPGTEFCKTKPIVSPAACGRRMREDEMQLCKTKPNLGSLRNLGSWLRDRRFLDRGLGLGM